MKNIVVLDLGSQYISGALVKDGVVITMPSVVAVSRDTGECLDVGSSAVSMASAGVKLVSPITCGTISQDNDKYASELIKQLLARVVGNSQRVFSKLSVVCAVPCAMISTEKRAIEDVLLALGVNGVSFVEAAVASSYELFEQFNINSALILDIGKDCSDAAVVSNNNIVKGCTLQYGGMALTKTILTTILNKTGIRIAIDQAETVKIKCASLYPDYNAEMKISGVNNNNNQVSTANINSKELYDVTSNYINVYCDVLNSLLYSADASVSSSVAHNGILLCGGSSDLIGLENYLQNKINLPVRLARNSRETVVNGLLKMYK